GALPVRAHRSKSCGQVPGGTNISRGQGLIQSGGGTRLVAARVLDRRAHLAIDVVGDVAVIPLRRPSRRTAGARVPNAIRAKNKFGIRPTNAEVSRNAEVVPIHQVTL